MYNCSQIKQFRPALQVWEKGSLKDTCSQIKDLNAAEGLRVLRNRVKKRANGEILFLRERFQIRAVRVPSKTTSAILREPITCGCLDVHLTSNC